MRVVYNFENKLLWYGDTMKSYLCGRQGYKYNIYGSGYKYALKPDGQVINLDFVSTNVNQIDIVTQIDMDESNNVLYTVETFDIIRPETCGCNKFCAYVVLYNVFGLDCISSSEYAIEYGGVERFEEAVYSLMQYSNIRIKCSVTFKDAEHSHAWKTSVGAFRKTYVYFDGKECDGYIDFSTLSFVDNDASCNFDVVAKIL